MPKYDWSNTTSATSGNTYIIPNGGYVLKITNATFGKSRSGNDQLVIEWDVADGQYQDVAALNGWYASKHTDYISFSPAALRFTKRKMECVRDSNNGFDAFRAIDNDAFQLFVGKLFGATLKCEYGEWQGKQTKKMVIDTWYTADDIIAGRFTVPKTEEPEPEPKPAVTATYDASAAAYPAGDLPF